MKLTHSERKTVRLWLDKDPRAETQVNKLTLTREDGTSLSLARTTTYLPGNKWKVRIAYHEETGYPVATSAPILANKTYKKEGMGTNLKPKFVMVPKLPPVEQPKPVWSWDDPGEVVPMDDHDHHVQVHKAALNKNKSAFAKALDAEIKAQTAHIKAQLNAPSILWDAKLWPKPDADGKVTFKMHPGDPNKGKVMLVHCKTGDPEYLAPGTMVSHTAYKQKWSYYNTGSLYAWVPKDTEPSWVLTAV